MLAVFDCPSARWNVSYNAQSRTSAGKQYSLTGSPAIVFSLKVQVIKAYPTVPVA